MIKKKVLTQPKEVHQTHRAFPLQGANKARFLGAYGPTTEEGNNVRIPAVITTVVDGRRNGATYSWASVFESGGKWYGILNPVSVAKPTGELHHKDTARALQEKGARGAWHFASKEMMPGLEVMEGTKGDELPKAGFTTTSVDGVDIIDQSPMSLSFKSLGRPLAGQSFQSDAIVVEFTDGFSRVANLESPLPMLCRSGGPRWFVSGDGKTPELGDLTQKEVSHVAKQMEMQQKVEIDGEGKAVSLVAINPAGEPEGEYQGLPVFWMMGEVQEGQKTIRFPSQDAGHPDTEWDCEFVPMTGENTQVGELEGNGSIVYVRQIRHSGSPHLHQYLRAGQEEQRPGGPLVFTGDRQKGVPVGATFPPLLQDDYTRGVVAKLPVHLQGDLFLAPQDKAELYSDQLQLKSEKFDDEEVATILSAGEFLTQMERLHNILVDRGRAPNKENARLAMYRLVGEKATMELGF